MNLPPGWKRTPRTQLSWPTCRKKKKGKGHQLRSMKGLCSKRLLKARQCTEQKTVGCDSPHQGHKAHASANIPHLDGFVSWAREQEGACFSTLFGLVGQKKADRPSVMEGRKRTKSKRTDGFCGDIWTLGFKVHCLCVCVFVCKWVNELNKAGPVAFFHKYHFLMRCVVAANTRFLCRFNKNDKLNNNQIKINKKTLFHCWLLQGQQLQGSSIVSIWQGRSWRHLRSQGVKEGGLGWLEVMLIFCLSVYMYFIFFHFFLFPSWRSAHMAERLSGDVRASAARPRAHRGETLLFARESERWPEPRAAPSLRDSDAWPRLDCDKVRLLQLFFFFFLLWATS